MGTDDGVVSPDLSGAVPDFPYDSYEPFSGTKGCGAGMFILLLRPGRGRRDEADVSSVRAG